MSVFSHKPFDLLVKAVNEARMCGPSLFWDPLTGVLRVTAGACVLFKDVLSFWNIKVCVTSQQFKKNLKGVNGNKDFDQDMLEDIYMAIK